MLPLHRTPMPVLLFLFSWQHRLTSSSPLLTLSSSKCWM
jgi:hypothetical protein